MGAMKAYLGDKMLKLTSTVEEKTRKLIESELEKVEVSNAAPELAFRPDAIQQVELTGKTLAEQFPPLNLNSVILHEEVNKLSGTNWVDRKNVLDKIISEIQKAQFHLAHEGLRDIIEVVNRLLQNEKNKSVKKQSILAIQ